MILKKISQEIVSRGLSRSRNLGRNKGNVENKEILPNTIRTSKYNKLEEIRFLQIVFTFGENF